jgi:ATP-dependent Lon protease
LPVGGIKQKILAAHRAGLTTVILPKRNEKDLEDLPDEVRNTLIFVTVDRIDEAFKVMFVTDQNGEEAANFSFTVNRSSV